MKIIISGGHLTPALSLIDYVLSQKNDNLVFVGRKYTQTKTQQKSVERDEVEKRGVTFLEFDSGKLDFTQVFQLPAQFIKFVASFFRAQKIMAQEKPDVFVSFGGYLAVPLALAAWVQGVPIITHEQTAASGTANQFISHFAKVVAISFPESATDFPQHKVVLTGNPIRQQLWNKIASKPEWAMKPSQRPLLYITGGSQGSQAINKTIQQLIPELVKEWDVVHQCGMPNTLMNYKEVLEGVKTHLPKEQQAQYVVREWISETELAWIYQHAWGIISRAGANTVQEVVHAEIPAIFIPLLHSHHDEQTRNAVTLVKKGAALLLSQMELDSDHLLNSLNTLKKDHESLRTNLHRYKEMLPMNADELVYNVIVKVGHAQ